MSMFLLDALPEEWDLANSPGYRRQQVREWVFGRRVTRFEQMTNLPAPLRERLQATYQLQPLQLARRQGSHDTTQKFLWALSQGDFVESVLIPANVSLFGERAARRTLCISTQVGCAYGCKFCASGLEGWKRNLTPGEIVAQVMEAERLDEARIQNLVFMGMGEPMANYANVMRAIEIINADWGLNIGARHITISTSGLVPQIKLLAEQPRQIRLAISLHGVTDAVRSRIMPVNQKYPLETLIGALDFYLAKKGQMITFEFILIEGVNDTAEQAQQLARLSRRLFAKVNLIPYNRVEGLPWERPSAEVMQKFVHELRKRDCPVTVRHEKGHDIDAACGQLRLQQLQASAKEASLENNAAA